MKTANEPSPYCSSELEKHFPAVRLLAERWPKMDEEDRLRFCELLLARGELTGLHLEEALRGKR